MRWMDRYVKGVEPAQARVEDDPAVEVEDGGLQRYRAEVTWPPADGVQRALTLKPGSYTEQPGNDGRAGPGRGIWSMTAPLPHAVHRAGVPRVTLDVETSGANVNLYDIDDRRRAMLVSRGAFRQSGPGRVTFDLYPQDWTFRAGHRVGFLVAQADDEWFSPPPSHARVEIKGGTLSAPFLTFSRSSFLPKPAERGRGEPADGLLGRRRGRPRGGVGLRAAARAARPVGRRAARDGGRGRAEAAARRPATRRSSACSAGSRAPSASARSAGDAPRSTAAASAAGSRPRALAATARS
jgi:hypothetical protein